MVFARLLSNSESTSSSSTKLKKNLQNQDPNFNLLQNENAIFSQNQQQGFGQQNYNPDGSQNQNFPDYTDFGSQQFGPGLNNQNTGGNFDASQGNNQGSQNFEATFTGQTTFENQQFGLGGQNANPFQAGPEQSFDPTQNVGQGFESQFGVNQGANSNQNSGPGFAQFGNSEQNVNSEHNAGSNFDMSQNPFEPTQYDNQGFNPSFNANQGSGTEHNNFQGVPSSLGPNQQFDNTQGVDPTFGTLPDQGFQDNQAGPQSFSPSLNANENAGAQFQGDQGGNQNPGFEQLGEQNIYQSMGIESSLGTGGQFSGPIGVHSQFSEGHSSNFPFNSGNNPATFGHNPNSNLQIGSQISSLGVQPDQNFVSSHINGQGTVSEFHASQNFLNSQIRDQEIESPQGFYQTFSHAAANNQNSQISQVDGLQFGETQLSNDNNPNQDVNAFQSNAYQSLTSGLREQTNQEASQHNPSFAQTENLFPLAVFTGDSDEEDDDNSGEYFYNVKNVFSTIAGGYFPTKYTSLDMAQVDFDKDVVQNSGYDSYLRVRDSDGSGEDFHVLVGVAPARAVQGGSAQTYSAKIGNTVPVYVEHDDLDDFPLYYFKSRSRNPGGSGQQGNPDLITYSANTGNAGGSFRVKAEGTLAGGNYAVIYDD